MSMKNLRHIIGLTGLAGAGKDTVRSILEQEHGYIGIAFANPIRAMIRGLLRESGSDLDYMEARELKERPIPGIGLSYRELAQTLGTEWGRTLHPELWVNIAKTSLVKDASHGIRPIRAVLSDVRFPNESEMIRSLGGEIWCVERPGTEPVRAHISEQHTKTLTPGRVIVNNGSIEQLRRRVAALVIGEGVVA